MAEDDTTQVGSSIPDFEALDPGDTFADLRIDGVAGRGGSGIVYRAWDLGLDQPRALKVLFPDLSRGPRFRERFERESRLLASLEHPSVVTVHRAGEHRGHLFLSMQLIDGETLADLLAREGPLNRERTVSILGQVASALDAARKQGLVHRDVKPANILISGERAYLTDFGIAKHTAAAEPLTAPGEMIGTANYVAPEQVTGGTVSGASDTYALACVAYECLTGSKPFERDSKLATLVAHTTDARPQGPGLDDQTSRVLRRGMAISPADRQETSCALIRDLESPPALRGLARFGGAGVALMAVAGLVAAGLAVVIATDGDKPDEPASRSASEAQSIPRAGTIERRISVIYPVDDIAVGNIKVWAAGGSGLTGVDPARGTLGPSSTSTNGRLSGVTVGLGSVWAVDRSGNLLRFDPASGAPPVVIPLGGETMDITTTLSAVWVALKTGEVVRVNGGNEVEARIEVGGEPVALAADEPLMWVADREGRVAPIDTQTNAVEREIEVEKPIDITVTDGTVWILSEDGGVQSIDRISRQLDESVSLEVPGASAIASGFGSLWMVDSRDGQVERLDPSGIREWDPVDVPGAVSLASGPDAVWVGTGGESRVVQVRPSSR